MHQTTATVPSDTTPTAETRWIGLLTLAEAPEDRKIIIVDNPDDYGTAIVLFSETMVVMSFEGDAAKLERSPFRPGRSGDPTAVRVSPNREIIIWPTPGNDLTGLARWLASANANVAVVTGHDRALLSFVGETAGAAVTYAKPLLVAVEAPPLDEAARETEAEVDARQALLSGTNRSGYIQAKQDRASAAAAAPKPRTSATTGETLPASPKRRARAMDAAAEAAQAPVADDDPGYTAWERLGLVLNGSNVPLPNIDNAARIIERHPSLSGRVWYDEFLGRTLTTWDSDEPREWCDADDTRLTLWIQRKLGIGKMPISAVQQAVSAVAHGNVRNEVAEWLASLEWDGRKRLAKLLREGFGAEDTEYHAAVGTCWMTAMIARAITPGCEVHAMPVFEGGQGAGKSKAVKIIGGKWATVCNTNILSPEFFKIIEGRLVVEVAELHAFSRSEVKAIKGIISTPKDRYRDSYGRRAVDHLRTCVFAGTTNEDDWNHDATGARRFWPVACGTVDLAWLRANRDQLFAEAYARYQSETVAHEDERTPASDWWSVPKDAATDEQDARRPEDSWDAAVREFLVGKRQVRMVDLLTEAIGLELARVSRSDELRMGTLLRTLGWTKCKRRVNGVQAKVWVPKGDEGGDEIL